MFNVFDTFGRFLGGFNPLMIEIDRRFWLQFLGFSRILLVALPICVEVGLFSNSDGLQNGLILLNPVLLAITNGYVQTIFACYAATIVSKTDAEEGHSLALGNLIGISITLGISVGGLL